MCHEKGGPTREGTYDREGVSGKFSTLIPS